MRLKLIVLIVFIIGSVGFAKAEENVKNSTSDIKRSDLRFMVSDGLTLAAADALGIGLADVITGAERADITCTPVLGVGYRYTVKRIRFGVDVAFATIKSNLTMPEEFSFSHKEKEFNFMILPTFEYIYLRSHIIELYGGLSAGADFTKYTMTNIDGSGQEEVTDNSTEFAFQVNPIAIRVGNQHIGGFFEAGFGYKGFFTLGLSVRF